MRVTTHRHKQGVSGIKPIVVYVFADTHIGAPETRIKILERHIAQCQKEKAYWVHLGDWCDYISPKDKRFSIDNPAPSIFQQVGMITQLFHPIKDKGLAILSGNHEETIRKNLGNPMTTGAGNGIAEVLGVPYLGTNGFLQLKFRECIDSGTRRTIIIFLSHGYGGGRKTGGKINKIEDLSTFVLADIHLMGHMHTYAHSQNQVLTISRHGRLKQKDRHYILCPSYLDIWKDTNRPNYGSDMLYKPQPIGCVRLEITLDKIKYELVTG